ncbi:MAG: hypothetical protein Q8O49_01505 [bacterium]|nr:hypothetical protein [bacterium]
MNANNSVSIPAWGWLGGFGLILIVALIPGSGESFGSLSRVMSALGQNVIVAAMITGVINLFLPRKLVLHFWRLIVLGVGLIILSGKIDLSGLLWIILLGAVLMTIFGLVISIITKSAKGFLAPFKWLGKFLSGKEKKKEFRPGDRVSWEDTRTDGLELTGTVREILPSGKIRVMGDDGITRQKKLEDLSPV